ncbi:MAG: glutamate-5-semialdehyde dehydrogenase [Candidatus Obscuribacterales bacterium]|jgi:glutamate-5-semialdehyde dehydrogenase|nr:glutamate-5-semialdehyde dehydrogenase [Candidatus Obscuribacterales bacterium]
MGETVSSIILQEAAGAKLASTELATATAEQRNNALIAMADALEAAADEIEAENAKDLAYAKEQVEQGRIKEALYGRLKFDKKKIADAAEGIRQVARLADPLGVCTLARELDQGLNLFRISCPLGLVAVIFESRPDAFPQIVSLSIKSGNAILLKGGKEAENSNRIIYKVLKSALTKSGLPESAVVLLETREDVNQMLKADEFVDLVIPRGSNDLVRFVQDNTRIPVLGHADGVCHIYIDDAADEDKALKIVLDAKTQYPSACNSVETLLIHKEKLESFLPRITSELQKSKVEVRLDESCMAAVNASKFEIDRSLLKLATSDDWTTEYCELVISIKAVESLSEAIQHINRFGSAHTESIITEDKAKFETFFQKVNSAGVFWNASTRFADGFRYGFGAEVGISTARMHPRGPVGLEGLVTYKYKIEGAGHIVGDYAGPNARSFTHRDL